VILVVVSWWRGSRWDGVWRRLEWNPDVSEPVDAVSRQQSSRSRYFQHFVLWWFIVYQFYWLKEL